MNIILSHAITALIVIIIFVIFYLIKYKHSSFQHSKVHVIEANEENELLKQVFDNASDLIFYKDADSRFIMANKFIANMMGEKDPKEVIGKWDFDYYDKKLAQEFYDDEQEIIRTKKPLIGKEETNINRKGETRVFSVSKIPIYNKKRKSTGIIGIARDITEIKNAQKELEKYSDTLRETNLLLEERQEEIQQMAEELNAQAENLRSVNAQLEKLSFVASRTGNVVVIMDGNGNFEWVNNEFEKIYGKSLDEFRKENGNNLRDNSSNVNISAILNQVYLTKESYTYNAHLTDYKGDEKWFQSNISPIIDDNDEIKNLILIDSEITELKLAEQQITNQNAEIEAQTEALKKTNATKDRLFSIIAHDLKNPFHSIMGFSDLLQKKYKDLTPEKIEEYLSMINMSTNSAYELLENLLDWARTQTDRTQFKPENITFKNCVDTVISLLSVHAKDKNITLSNEVIPELSVFADKNMLRTIIRNITGNAIKYTNENGFITFAAYADKESTILEIVDTGIGMPESKSKDLFNLNKINSTAGTSGETGTGLGLIVCHEFMTLNGGKIEVESHPGKGTNIKLIFRTTEKSA